MPILTPSQAALGRIESATKEFETRLASCATVGNRMVQILLDLSDADLSEALNLLEAQYAGSGGAAGRFAKHGQSGECVNTAIANAAELLERAPRAQIDVRSFAEKLADQRRTISFDGTTWTVSTLPPPEPPADQPPTEDQPPQ